MRYNMIKVNIMEKQRGGDLMYSVLYDKDGKVISRKIVDDRWADTGPLLDCMCEMYREHLARQEAMKGEHVPDSN
jgi:hypothetical protein